MSEICSSCGNVIQPWAHGVCYNCVRIAREQHKYGRRRPPRSYQAGKQKQREKPSRKKRTEKRPESNEKSETQQEAKRSKTKDLDRQRQQAGKKPPPGGQDVQTVTPMKKSRTTQPRVQTDQGEDMGQQGKATDLSAFLEVDLLIRQALLESWRSLPHDSRDFDTLKRTFLHLVDQALDDSKSNLELIEASDGQTDYQKRMARIKAEYPRAYEKWTADEEKTLREKLASGFTIKEIAEFLQRQPGAIRSRLQKLGLN